MRKVYLDVSDTIAMRLNTGIQRVVRRIVLEATQLGAGYGVEIIPVVVIGNRVAPLNKAGLEVLHTPRKETGQTAPELIDGHTKLKAVLKLAPTLYSFIRQKYSERRSFGGLYGRTVGFSKTDVLVFLDSFWNENRAARLSKSAKKYGLVVFSVVYDVIPITHPQYCDAGLIRLFSDCFYDMVNFGVRFVSISKDSAEMVRRIASSRGYQGEVGSFYLGHDLPITHDPAPMNWPDGLWSGNAPVHLMVGTIEPRKGVDVALAAMELLWAAGQSDKLLIIGRVGWMVDALLNKARNHPEIGKRLFLIHNANDTMLDHAYNQASDCIVASYIEGFGLPLIEALSKSLPVIASNIDVFRELTPDLPIFFTPGDSNDLARAIEQMSTEHDKRKVMAQRFEWITWRDSARQLIESVLHQANTSATALAREPVA